MIVIGAKGFAKELLEDLVSPKYGYNEFNLFFFDDLSKDLGDKLFSKYQILTNISEVENILKNISKEFALGLGTPKYRKKLAEKFELLGGKPKTIISDLAKIGSFNNNIGLGSTIMGGTQITNNIKIGKGVLINLNCTIGHDAEIEDYVELTPSVNISGHCKIGTLTTLGTGAVVIPGVVIGRNCIIGAGSVVTKDVPDNSVVVGIPGKVIKTLENEI